MHGASEPAEEQITKVFSTAANFAERGHLEPTLITAWAGFEAAMRKRLCVAGEKPDWKTLPWEAFPPMNSLG